MSGKDLEKIQQELKWVQIQDERDHSFSKKVKSKGILGFLVPAGCLVTTGVLFTGVYQMYQRNQKAQQHMMRYRVAAQGITILLAMTSMLVVSFSEPNSD